ncbi:MAG: HAD family hydrolase [Candidatus Omnitrophota bacterium]
MENIKLIIFDLDGTIVDAYPAIISSFNYAMEKTGYPLQSGPAIRKAVGWGDENLLEPFVGKRDLKKALKAYRLHHKKSLLVKSRLFPGTRQLLKYLRDRGYKLAVASNRPTRFSWLLIRHLKLRPYFSYVLCADRVKYGKPHPGLLKKIIRRFRVASSRVIYVGDMTIDAQAGRRAGVKTVIVTTGSSSRREVRKERPCLIISNIVKLKELL